MNSKYHLYLGKAGQFAAMSIFLMRGWNVATPEVDVGDDMFVIDDKRGFFTRIQVKTSQATLRQNGYSSRFKVPIKQLIEFSEPELCYVFVTGRDNAWFSQVVVMREQLMTLYLSQSVGSVVQGNLMLYFSFHHNKVTCSDIDFTPYLNNFDEFPIIKH